ncbi:MAG: hypothetical protein HY695_22055 [Deltaproteobacteria bacterium]|nr:hypothetical protein [Deltaproteobacteria bacterium]
MDPVPKKCMLCGKLMPIVKGSICDPCQDRVRREAMGDQDHARGQAEKELKRHGVNPESGKVRK